MRKGFTLIEILVASLLLSMLVTILTMIFNQSSIAWRTGTAGIAKMEDSRRELGTFHDCRDEALPGLTQGKKYGKDRSIEYRTVSVFDEQDSNKLRKGADARTYKRIVWSPAPSVNSAGDQGKSKDISGGEKDGTTYTVGVRSAGPNKEFGDDDDITTWPDDVF